MNNDNFINLNILPKIGVGKYINWNLSVGLIIDFKYKNTNGFFKIIENIDTLHVMVLYNNTKYRLKKLSLTNNKLGNLMKRSVTNSNFEIGDIIDNVKNGLLEVLDILYIKGVKTYKCQCLKCGEVISKTWYEIEDKSGCSVCSGAKVKVGFNDMWTTAAEVAKLLLNPDNGYKYTKSSQVRLDWKCPKCSNIIKGATPANISGYGLTCSSCSDSISYPNKFMFNLLSQLHIKFQTEKTFDWTKTDKDGYLKYDFYLSDYNTIIEMHGRQHYDKTMYYDINEVKENDNKKRYLANKNGVDNYIIIDSRFSELEWIKSNILKSGIVTIINVDDIDWNLIEKKSQSSVFLKVCNLWNEGITDVNILSDLSGLSLGTITNYLKKSKKLNLTNYSKEITRSTGVIKLKEKIYNRRATCLICIETQDVFGSIQICEDMALDVLKVSISRSGISQVAHGKRGSVKGYRFRFISKEEFNLIKKTEPHRAYGDFFII